MRSLRAAIFTLACLTLLGPTRADVQTVRLSHVLAPPPGQTFTQPVRNVAIDGTSIIVLATHDGGQSALLYQRLTGSSQFTYQKTLLTFVYPRERMQVRMRNGIAVVHFGDRAWIFEKVGNRYVLGQTAAPLRHPGGVAISAKSILFGGDNCDYDAVVYEKRPDGVWDITGRMDDNQGQCHPEGRAVELHYGYALLQEPGENRVDAWRRNGTALDWVPAGSQFANASASEIPRLALQKSTAVTPGSLVSLREGNTWDTQSYLRPLDFGESGLARDVVYRDGVLLTTHAWRVPRIAKPYAYIETAPGFFEHVAILETEWKTIDFDVSGRTVVAATEGVGGGQEAVVFVLPEPLAAPPPIPDDFENRDTSDFTFASGQFALAARGSNDVLAQTSTADLSVALANDSDWNNYQRIEAHIAPTFGATDGWVGLVARYTDANNYYFVAVRNNNTFGIYRRLNGVNTLLQEGTSAGPYPSRVKLIVDRANVRVEINQQYAAVIADRSLTHGRAGLATFRAAADFDDVHVAATAPRLLLRNQYYPDGPDDNPTDAAPFNTIGGSWELRRDAYGFLDGFRQLDSSRTALAFIGGPARNQEIDVSLQINTFATETGSWVGVLGRYVDQRTHYFATLRNTGRIEIRKRVNDAQTVLASANLNVVAGQFYRLRFRLVEDQLQLWVGQALVLSARDDEIPEGQQGLATHRSTATWSQVIVTQP